jgi:hypothetical protein
MTLAKMRSHAGARPSVGACARMDVPHSAAIIVRISLPFAGLRSKLCALSGRTLVAVPQTPART